jgi:hypothetical protein
MCDYSLYAFPNRLAHDNEELVTCRFSSGCVGFTGVSDATERKKHRTFCGIGWTELKPWFFPRRHEGPPAVCIAPGTRMRLVSLGRELQLGLELGETEEAIFIQVSAEAFTYRDGLQFRNGRRILLQQLPEGQHAFVGASTGGEVRSDDQRDRLPAVTGEHVRGR